MKKKSLFFKSAFILLLGSLITRILGFFIRIVFTRIIGSDGISLYSLVMPTYSLVIALTQLGLPLAISTVVARGERRGKIIITSIIPVVLILNIIMMSLIILSSRFIAITLLDNSDAVYPIMAMSLILPFISISSILRGYFFGKQKMMPHTISNIIEQITRLIIILLFLPKLINKGSVFAVSGFILLSIISELVSIVIFLLYLPKGFTISMKDLKPDLKTTKEITDLCIPTVGGRIIGNIAYFFEPVILTYVLKYVGYSNYYIISEYGIYNAYVLPMLMIPSFIVQAVSTALIPEISKSYAKKDIRMVKKRIKESIILTLVLGIITNTFVFMYPEFLLSMIYKTSEGVSYIRILSFFFILYNLEGPLSSTLQALGKTKLAFRATTTGVIVKTISLSLFSLLNIGLYGLVIGEILDILCIVFINYKNIKKVLY